MMEIPMAITTEAVQEKLEALLPSETDRELAQPYLRAALRYDTAQEIVRRLPRYFVGEVPLEEAVEATDKLMQNTQRALDNAEGVKSGLRTRVEEAKADTLIAAVDEAIAQAKEEAQEMDRREMLRTGAKIAAGAAGVAALATAAGWAASALGRRDGGNQPQKAADPKAKPAQKKGGAAGNEEPSRGGR